MERALMEGTIVEFLLRFTCAEHETSYRSRSKVSDTVFLKDHSNELSPLKSLTIEVAPALSRTHYQHEAH